MLNNLRKCFGTCGVVPNAHSLRFRIKYTRPFRRQGVQDRRLSKTTEVEKEIKILRDTYAGFLFLSLFEKLSEKTHRQNSRVYSKDSPVKP
jgi:hypothetical protein